MDPARIDRIRLLKGPQFSEDAAAALTEAEFTVAAGNRMGIQLDGPPVPGGQVVSEGNPTGAVQVRIPVDSGHKSSRISRLSTARFLTAR